MHLFNDFIIPAMVLKSNLTRYASFNICCILDLLYDSKMLECVCVSEYTTEDHRFYCFILGMFSHAPFFFPSCIVFVPYINEAYTVVMYHFAFDVYLCRSQTVYCLHIHLDISYRIFDNSKGNHFKCLISNKK